MNIAEVAMATRRRACRRRIGATTLEFAIVAPIALLFLIGGVNLALGVYRYQQIAYLARAGARYASTHGAQYRADNRLSVGNAIWFARPLILIAVCEISISLSAI